MLAQKELKKIHFNPRPPWGGRHNSGGTIPSISVDFNPRPPWGGRLYQGAGTETGTGISIHALRGEGDVHQCY